MVATGTGRGFKTMRMTRNTPTVEMLNLPQTRITWNAFYEQIPRPSPRPSETEFLEERQGNPGTHSTKHPRGFSHQASLGNTDPSVTPDPISGFWILCVHSPCVLPELVVNPHFKGPASPQQSFRESQGYYAYSQAGSERGHNHPP